MHLPGTPLARKGHQRKKKKKKTLTHLHNPVLAPGRCIKKKKGSLTTKKEGGEEYFSKENVKKECDKSGDTSVPEALWFNHHALGLIAAWFVGNGGKVRKRSGEKQVKILGWVSRDIVTKTNKKCGRNKWVGGPFPAFPACLCRRLGLPH